MHRDLSVGYAPLSKSLRFPEPEKEVSDVDERDEDPRRTAVRCNIYWFLVASVARPGARPGRRSAGGSARGNRRHLDEADGKSARRTAKHFCHHWHPAAGA